jgi:hypothetical protein
MTLQKYFSHLSLVVYFSPTPPIKLKLGLEIGGELLIANHLDQSITMGYSETLISSQITFITLFSAPVCIQVQSVAAAPFTSKQPVELCGANKTNFLSQTGTLSPD